MPDGDPQIFRWLLLILIVLNLGVSSYYRKRARSKETISRSAEPWLIRSGRIAFALPGILFLVTYVIDPSWVAGSSLTIPLWSRWLGVFVGFSVVPTNVWIFRSLGQNVSETFLTKTTHRLITEGPYRWVRHPLYASSFIMLGGFSFVAANWLMATLTVGAVVWFSVSIIPLEERELVKKFGDCYRVYQRQTGCLLPKRY